MDVTSMQPSAPFGATDDFYFEAFSQEEAFAAVDAENTRRGFDKARKAACTSSDSCTSTLESSSGQPYSTENSSLNYVPASAAQHKGSRLGATNCTHLRFVRPWCREAVRAGRAAPIRKYVAASYYSMWEKIQALLCNRRHVYEIIRESTPCNIYFDLEFATEENRNVDANAITDCLLNIVAGLARAAWGVSIEPKDVLEMDSYNPKKFSRHIVIKLPNAAFLSGPALGSFVKDGILKHKLAHTLQIKSGGALVPIIDTTVYSSKAPSGGSCPNSGGTMFRLSGRYPPGVCMKPFPYQWLDSLICNVPYSPNLLHFTAQEMSRVSSFLVTRVLPPISKINTASASLEGHLVQQKKQVSYVNVVDLDGVNAVECNVQVKWLFGAQASPALTNLLRRSTSYMIDMARQICGGNVWIRKVCVLGSRGLVAFDLDGPGGHYCSWEKRCHRNNFTLLKVDFWHGTFAHQCWDPVCKSKYQQSWNAHAYELPAPLKSFKHLFLDPEELDPCLESELVPTDGEKQSTCPKSPGPALPAQVNDTLSSHANCVTNNPKDDSTAVGTVATPARSLKFREIVMSARVGSHCTKGGSSSVLQALHMHPSGTQTCPANETCSEHSCTVSGALNHGQGS